MYASIMIITRSVNELLAECQQAGTNLNLVDLYQFNFSKRHYICFDLPGTSKENILTDEILVGIIYFDQQSRLSIQQYLIHRFDRIAAAFARRGTLRAKPA